MGKAVPFSPAILRNKSGWSEIIPSTPMSIILAMSAGLFTVQTTTGIPRSWDSDISAGLTSPKYGDQIAPPAALIARGSDFPCWPGSKPAVQGEALSRKTVGADPDCRLR